jgi:hypothetical protein
MITNRTTASRYLMVHDPNSRRPWIILRSYGRPHWTEITRYTTEEEARTYIKSITDNQHHYLETHP